MIKGNTIKAPHKTSTNKSEGNKKHKSYDKHTTDQYQSNVNQNTADETTQPIKQPFLDRAQMTTNLH